MVLTIFPLLFLGMFKKSIEKGFLLFAMSNQNINHSLEFSSSTPTPKKGSFVPIGVRFPFPSAVDIYDTFGVEEPHDVAVGLAGCTSLESVFPVSEEALAQEPGRYDPSGSKASPSVLP